MTTATATRAETINFEDLFMANGTGIEAEDNLTISDYAELMDCPDYDKEALAMVDYFSFWVEGVFQTSVGILGIIGNALASVILTRKEMRNAFNLLLVTMACFDSTYLFGSILESFRKQFNLASKLHIILFPYLLYPFNQIAITASIFMTVAIALERFIAVHYPLNYSQAMHEANALSKRIVKYVASVSFLAVLFTATRFFEAKVVYDYIYDPVTNETIDYKLSLEPTHLRTAPIYTAYFNWSRLIVLGIIPFVMLVYLNAKIYKDIKARRNRRLNHPRNLHHPHNKQQQPKKSQRWLKTCLACFRRLCGRRLDDNGNNSNHSSTDDNDAVEMTTMRTGTQIHHNGPAVPGGVTVNESRRKKEDNLAVIFMGFIMVFLICHLPRLLLNIHELATIRHAMECQRAGLKAFPLWSLIMISLSHLLLVINSSTNILIYCCLSSKFRDECRKVFRKL